MVVAAPLPASAQDVEGVPWTGTYGLTGGGWGHGHGLSQYGAQGAAYQGQTAAQILSFYYAGTASTTIASDTIRVRLAELYGSSLAVSPASSLSATSSGGQTWTLPSGPSRWRLVRSSDTTFSLDSLTGSTWTPRSTYHGMSTFSGPSRLTVWLGSVPRAYDGWATTYSYGGAQNTNVVTGIESYVAGVVPYEMGGSFPTAALQAQAVAARTYGWYQRTSRRAQGLPYDVWDSTSDQVFRGPAGRTASTDAATAATTGQIRTYGGQVIFAQFGSSDGGWTSYGGKPYLAARADPWERYSSNPYQTWHAAMSVSGLRSWLGLSTVTGVRLSRDTSTGGHVTTVVVTGTGNGSTTSVTVSGDDVRLHYGLKSTYFSLDPLPARANGDFTGSGQTSVALWRPGSGVWYPQGSTSVQYGRRGDIPVPGSYSGGETSQLALFRPSSGDWYFRNHHTVQFGRAGDIPVPGDYVGDGRTHVALYRPSTGQWFVRNHATLRWGRPGDIPVPADYTGDGRTDISMWRPSSGTWYIRGQAPVQYGRAGDVPVPADYTGDGRADVAIFRPQGGIWAFRGHASIQYGRAGDLPVPGYYDRSGHAFPALWRASAHLWEVRDHASHTWGVAGDVPLVVQPSLRRTST